MKPYILPLFILFASCTDVVYFKSPLPKHHKNLINFSDKIQGRYLVTDTLIDKELEIKNSLYSPQKSIKLDTTIQCIGRLEVYIFKDIIVSKTWHTFYTYKSNNAFLKEPDNEDKDVKVEYIGDTLKVEADVEVDTIINLKKRDVVRSIQNHLILNRMSENGYRVIMLRVLNDSILEIRDLYKNDFLNYMAENENQKKYKAYDDAIDKKKAVDISNVTLRKLIKSNSFKKRITLQRMHVH